MLIFDYVCLNDACKNKEERLIRKSGDFQFCSKCKCEMKKMLPRVAGIQGNSYNDKCGTK